MITPGWLADCFAAIEAKDGHVEDVYFRARPSGSSWYGVFYRDREGKRRYLWGADFHIDVTLASNVAVLRYRIDGRRRKKVFRAPSLPSKTPAP